MEMDVQRKGDCVSEQYNIVL